MRGQSASALAISNRLPIQLGSTAVMKTPAPWEPKTFVCISPAGR